MTRILERGSNGPAVVRLQHALTARGYDPGPVDGAFGQRTERAVIRFQAHVGIVVDGQVGLQTSSALAHKPEHKQAQKLTEAERFAQLVKQRTTGRDDHPRPNYVFGAEVPAISDRYPGKLDCSEAVQWGVWQITKDPWIDGSYNQARAVKRLSVDKARETVGALVFLTTDGSPDGVVHHVGVVCTQDGEPYVAQARSAYTDPECGIWPFDEQSWVLAGTVPILRYR